MHQLNTKNIEIHEWEHECIHNKSKTIHVAGIIYLNQKMISKDWLSIKKDNSIKQMKFLKFPHESYLVKIQTQTSFSFFPSRAEPFNVRRFQLSSEAQRGNLNLYTSSVSLLYFSSKNRGSASSACKSSPNVSETPKSLRTSSLHSLRPL